MNPEVIAIGGGILAGISGMVLTGWVIYIIVDGFRRRQQLRTAAEFQNKLLERVGSARDLGELLNSEGGAKLLDSLSVGGETMPHLRILRALQTGLVLLLLGVGLFVFALAVDLEWPAFENVTFLGVVSSTIGLGLLLSSFISLRLSRRMGLINGQQHRPSNMTPSV